MTVSRLALLLAAAFACQLPAHAAGPAPAAGDDFYLHINGSWQAAAVIPADHTSWSILAQVSEENYQRMRDLYTAAAHNLHDATARRVGLYYLAQLDEAAINTAGLAPLEALLQQIAALDSKQALAAFLGANLRADADPLNQGLIDSENLLGLWVGPGVADNRRYTAHLVQGGLGLPDPDSYLSADAEQRTLRAAYRAHIAALLALSGTADAQAQAQQILALETRIASVHANRPDSTDPAKTATLWRPADFHVNAPGLDWTAYFDAAGLSSQAALGAWQAQAITGIAALVNQVPLEAWKPYLRFHAINSHARFLPQAYADRYFAFYDPLYLGPSQHFPRWVHAVNQTNTVMPGAGRLFVERYFPAPAKARAQQMVARLRTAMHDRIGQLEWMTPATRIAALAKLDNMEIGVGYPDQWRDSEGLEIRAGDPVGNLRRVAAFNTRYAISKLGMPVDRRAWVLGGELFGINRMPLQNAITLPAFELQAPFFDVKASDAANYGAIGAKIGRALLSMLDEKGSRYDANGQLHSWWSADDAQRYQQAAAPLVSQYGTYHPFADITLNGQQTLNQNAINLGGLQAAYDAYHRVAKDNGDDRRFFSSYAQSLRVKDSEQALRGQSLGSPLAPAPYRVAAVRNLESWYRAYDVHPGQALYLAPAQRVRLW